jgi:hypothetical protein
MIVVVSFYSLNIRLFARFIYVLSIDCLVAIVTADLVDFISADCQLSMSQSFDHQSLRSLNH